MKKHFQPMIGGAMPFAQGHLLLKRSLILSLLVLLSMTFISQVSAQTLTFTNAGSTGAYGPTQSEVNTAYSNTSLDGKVSVTNGIQYWLVQNSGIYKISAYGAQGGGGNGGYGASIIGELSLTAGDTLMIIVGQQGMSFSSDRNVGGGGGTFLAKKNGSTITPLMVAGGGGGAMVSSSITSGVTSNSATSGEDAGGVQGTGGTNGNGGGGASCRGGGGGGWLSNGAVGGCGGVAGNGGLAFLNGGEGGSAGTTGAEGGFGGGGSSEGTNNAWVYAGGGGGYSGGGGASTSGTTAWGGGGGSYNSGTNQANTAGARSGHGLLTIEALTTGAFNDAGVVDIPSPAAFCTGSHNVVAKVMNFGSNVLDSVTVNWTVNNNAQSPVKYIGTIDTVGGTGNSLVNVTLGSFNFGSTAYSIHAWTSAPNGGTDTVNVNDTTKVVKQANIPAPTALNSGIVDSTSAKIRWTAGSASNTFAYVNSTLNQVPTGPGTALSADSVQLTGLIRATTYYFYVREICSTGDSSTWAGPFIYKTTCSGPLSGTYSVDPGQAVSNSNFASLSDALEALYTCTIAGPVTFNVAANTGPFTGGTELTAITGASATNTVTLNGNGNVVNESAAGYFLALNGVSYLTINDFQFINTAPTVAKFGIMMRGASHHIQITNNLIDMGTGVTSTSGGGIILSNVTTSATTAGNNAQYVTITGNEIVGGYYGITLVGQASYTNNYGHIVANNIIRDFYSYGVYMLNADTVTVEKNDISRSNRTSLTTFYGTYMSTCRNMKILKNVIHSSGIGSYTAHPIYITTSVNSSGYETEIINNKIYDIPTTSTLYAIYGLGTRNYINIYHNTVDLNPTGSGTVRVLFLSTAPDNHNVKNNIFSLRGSGTGTKHGIYVTTTSTSFVSNNNVIYLGASGTNHTGFWTANRTSLTDWQTASGQDGNSVNINPQFAQPSSGNYAPLTTAVDNLGTSVGVGTDILGNTRSGSTPDIGSYEFTGIAGDVSLVSGELFHEHICYNSNDTAEFIIANPFGATVNFATDSLTLVWNVSGPINSSGTLVINSDTLAAGSSRSVKAYTVNMSTPGTYYLNAYIKPNAANLSAFNDTLAEAFEFTVRSILDVRPALTTLNNYGDSIELVATSTLFPGGDVSITEVKHNHTTTGAPSGGWPSYMGTADYIEITGVPNADLAGYEYEAWSGTAMHYSYVFPSGTVFSPNGTMIFVMGQVGTTSASPNNFYYVITGVTSFDFQSGGPGGHLIKDPSGKIVDAVFVPSTTITTFPSGANVTSADWSGTLASGSGTCGHRRIGNDVNTPTNWVVSSATYPQDPNTVNSGVTVPVPGTLTGFSWKLNGVVQDTVPNLMAGPYTTHGTNTYIGTYTNVCGTFYDTAVVIVPPIIDLAADLVLPSSITCGNDVALQVKISNDATENIDFNIDNATITVEVTGKSTQTFTLVVDDNSFNSNQPLLKGTSMTVPLGNLNIDATGTYYLVASVSVANDLDANNDEDAMDTIVLNSIADAGPDYQVCSGSPSFIGGSPTATGGTAPFTYVWTPSGNFANTTLANPQITVNTNTTAVVTVTDDLGCYSVDSMLVEALSVPFPAVSGDTLVCIGIHSYSTPFNAGTTYLWSVVGGTIVGSDTSDTVNISWSQSGTGSVSVKQTITAGGCFATTSPYTVTINPNPTITFTATGNTTFCSGGSVNLLAIPQTGFSYAWRKDGNTLSGASSNLLTASASGDYKVVITNSNGCTDSSSAITVTVNPLPSATITPASGTTFCQGDSVLLNANTGTGLSYQWLLNGSAINGATADFYATGSGGNYTVQVTNANGCMATASQQTVTVNALPTASIVAMGATTVCQGQDVYLSAVPVSGASYQWRLNGTDISGATTANYTATATGVYSVEVTSSASCEAISNSITVTVNSLPTATITPAGATTFCDGGFVVLNANTGTGFSYRWMLNGATISGATGSSGAVSAPGNYTVEVTNAQGCSLVSSALTVTVNPLPTATIIAMGPLTFCLGDHVYLSAIPVTGATYEWNLDGNPISGATASTYMATASGNYTVEVTSSAACSQISNTLTVTVNPLPIATITPSGATSFCDGGSVNLVSGATSGTTHQWYSNGLPISGATSGSYVATQSGVYSLKTTSAQGCEATSTPVVVTVNPLPMAVIIFTGPTTLCQGESSVLVGLSQSGYTYQWLKDGNAISGATSNMYTAVQSGTYSLEVSSSANCKASTAGVAIIVNPLPGATISPAGPTSVCSGNTVVLNANSGPGLSYQWYHNGNILTNAISASYTAVISGNYTVRVTSAAGCMEVSAITAVTINPAPTASVSAQGTTSICDGNNVVLVAATASNGTYQWMRDGVAINGQTSTSYTATTGGDYTIVVTDVVTGCVSQSTPVTVDVSPMPVALFSATDICLGADVNFNNQSSISSGTMTYAWTFDDGNSSTDENPVHTYAAAGTYSVTMTATSTSGINCQADYSMDVTVFPTPVSTFTAGNMGNNLVNFVADDITGSSYKWNFGDGDSSANMNVQHQYAASGTYVVTLRVTNPFACESLSTETITLSPTGIQKAEDGFSFGIYPNPFQSETKIAYELNSGSDVKIEVYDQLGRLILVLSEGVEEAGPHVHVLNPADIAPQTLIIRLTVDNKVYNQKVVLMR